MLARRARAAQSCRYPIRSRSSSRAWSLPRVRRHPERSRYVWNRALSNATSNQLLVDVFWCYSETVENPCHVFIARTFGVGYFQFTYIARRYTKHLPGSTCMLRYSADPMALPVVAFRLCSTPQASTRRQDSVGHPRDGRNVTRGQSPRVSRELLLQRPWSHQLRAVGGRCDRRDGGR